MSRFQVYTINKHVDIFYIRDIDTNEVFWKNHDLSTLAGKVYNKDTFEIVPCVMFEKDKIKGAFFKRFNDKRFVIYFAGIVPHLVIDFYTFVFDKIGVVDFILHPTSASHVSLELLSDEALSTFLFYFSDVIS